MTKTFTPQARAIMHVAAGLSLAGDSFMAYMAFADGLVFIGVLFVAFALAIITLGAYESMLHHRLERELEQNIQMLSNFEDRSRKSRRSWP